MLVAALDTATLSLSVALCTLEQGEVRLVGERLERAAARPGPQGPTGGHGGRLPGALLELVEAAGQRLADLEGYAVGLGPGSFTGLRIGLATLKGLAYGQGRPIAGASSLAALALSAVPGTREGALLVPLLDAKKGEVYAGFYRVEEGRVVAALPEAALAPAALAARVEALAAEGFPVHLFGEGLAACGAAARGLPTLDTEVVTPRALSVARLCAQALAQGYDPAKLFALEPHYVRPSEAELKFPSGLPYAGRNPG
ncbi:MAG TPA: tRNA (adenosine(37)-N6)-threonylcarbamoyltransferase complex dimerization subunit type 1 TsaB [Anaeromyxobacteraceae bacterium]|nr:tRNA (adenosine(37)-N6)-threonylcarbamoyltransferase complex dimerization subunit type 1 TsaB [Anaeromyxobacteraceae bacterium]